MDVIVANFCSLPKELRAEVGSYLPEDSPLPLACRAMRDAEGERLFAIYQTLKKFPPNTIFPRALAELRRLDPNATIPEITKKTIQKVRDLIIDGSDVPVTEARPILPELTYQELTRREEEITNRNGERLVHFFTAIVVPRSDDARFFLRSLNGEVNDRAVAIRNWMQANQEHLNQIREIGAVDLGQEPGTQNYPPEVLLLTNLREDEKEAVLRSANSTSEFFSALVDSPWFHLIPVERLYGMFANLYEAGRVSTIRKLMGSDRFNEVARGVRANIHAENMPEYIAVVRSILDGRLDAVSPITLSKVLPVAASFNASRMITAILRSPRADVISIEALERVLRNAASTGHLAIINALLASRRLSDISREALEKTFSTAAFKGHLAIVNAILESSRAGDISPEAFDTAFHFAAFQGCLDVVNALLASRRVGDISIDTLNEALLNAGESGDLGVVNAVLGSSRSEEIFERTLNDAFVEADSLGHEEVAGVLREFLRNKRQNARP